MRLAQGTPKGVKLGDDLDMVAHQVDRQVLGLQIRHAGALVDEFEVLLEVRLDEGPLADLGKGLELTVSTRVLHSGALVGDLDAALRETCTEGAASHDSSLAATEDVLSVRLEDRGDLVDEFLVAPGERIDSRREIVGNLLVATVAFALQFTEIVVDVRELAQKVFESFDGFIICSHWLHLFLIVEGSLELATIII